MQSLQVQVPIEPKELMNIWLVDENNFDEFAMATGGKVVCIAEDPPARLKNHPALVTAGILLPPIEAIELELDGNTPAAFSIYANYLSNTDASNFVYIILAAAIMNIPLGIMFGRDEMNMQFPKMFIDLLYNNFGMEIGVRDKLQPAILQRFVPHNLATLYNANIIDYRTFMEKHPSLPIAESCISKMAYDINPAVKVKDFGHYAEYFNCIKNQIIANGHKFLVDPLEGI